MLRRSPLPHRSRRAAPRHPRRQQTQRLPHIFFDMRRGSPVARPQYPHQPFEHKPLLPHKPLHRRPRREHLRKQPSTVRLIPRRRQQPFKHSAYQLRRQRVMARQPGLRKQCHRIRSGHHLFPRRRETVSQFSVLLQHPDPSQQPDLKSAFACTSPDRSEQRRRPPHPHRWRVRIAEAPSQSIKLVMRPHKRRLHLDPAAPQHLPKCPNHAHALTIAHALLLKNPGTRGAHLRDSFIVSTVGIRAKHGPHSITAHLKALRYL